MNINQLKYFIAVAETESFTKAAEGFFISQTAITQQIRSLEETIGIKLIDRSTRPISLTPGGKVFLREAKAILNHMDIAVTRSQEASTGLSGTLRIGYTKGYEQSRLPRLLRDFRREYPAAHAFHLSGKSILDSGMTYRNAEVSMGLPGISEFQVWRTDAEAIRLAREALTV